jgi:hypothetical protein
MGPHLAVLYHAMLLAVLLSVGIVAFALAFCIVLAAMVIWEAFYDATKR